jgi:formylglycine-generating enzyme required for sulfatase activity
VERVSWYQGIEFCQRLSLDTGKIYTLPSGTAWEYACRGVVIPLLSGLEDEVNLIKEWNQKYCQPFYFGENITPDLVNYNANSFYGKASKWKCIH